MENKLSVLHLINEKLHKHTLFFIYAEKFTFSLSQSSIELQDDSSKGTLGSKSSLTLTVEDDEVRTTRLRYGFFLHDRSTFNVPSTAGPKISSYIQCKIYV